MKKYIIGFIAGALCFVSFQALAASFYNYDFESIKINGLASKNKAMLLQIGNKDNANIKKIRVFTEDTLKELGYTFDNKTKSLNYTNPISSVVIDGDALVIKPDYKPMIINNTTYLPSYLFKDMGFTVSKENDKFDFLMNGKSVYPDLNPGSNFSQIADHLKVNTYTVKGTVSVDAKSTYKDEAGKMIGNYVHSFLRESEIQYSFTLNNEYKRFSSAINLNKFEQSGDKVTVEFYLDDSTTPKKTISIDANTPEKDKIVNVNLRNANKMTVILKNQTTSSLELALVNPAFIK